MSARIVQIVTRYLGTMLAVLLGKLGLEYGEGQIDSIIGPIMTGFGLLLSIIVDHYLHRAQDAAKKRGIDLN